MAHLRAYLYFAISRFVAANAPALLSVKHDDIIHVACFLVRTLERARACLSIRRNRACYDHRHLAVLLLNYLRRVGIDPLDG